MSFCKAGVFRALWEFPLPSSPSGYLLTSEQEAAAPSVALVPSIPLKGLSSGLSSPKVWKVLSQSSMPGWGVGGFPTGNT